MLRTPWKRTYKQLHIRKSQLKFQDTLWWRRVCKNLIVIRCIEGRCRGEIKNLCNEFVWMDERGKWWDDNKSITYHQSLDCFNHWEHLMVEETKNLPQEDLLVVALRSSDIIMSVHSLMMSDQLLRCSPCLCPPSTWRFCRSC